MDSTEKQFPRIRVFGTIGWSATGLFIGFLKLEAQSPPHRHPLRRTSQREGEEA